MSYKQDDTRTEELFEALTVVPVNVAAVLLESIPELHEVYAGAQFWFDRRTCPGGDSAASG